MFAILKNNKRKKSLTTYIQLNLPSRQGLVAISVWILLVLHDKIHLMALTRRLNVAQELRPQDAESFQ